MYIRVSLCVDVGFDFVHALCFLEIRFANVSTKYNIVGS